MSNSGGYNTGGMPQPLLAERGGKEREGAPGEKRKGTLLWNWNLIGEIVGRKGGIFFREREKKIKATNEDYSH